MSIIGYARVSTTDQSLEIQEQQLRNAGVEKLFAEQKSGSSADNRPMLQQMLDYVREGDVVVITRLDRLARSVVDLRTIIDRLQAKGVEFRCIHQPLDTTSPHGKLMLSMLGAFAEFELDLRKERQREGIDKAKAAGRYRGGKPKEVNPARIAELKADGLTPAEIGKRLGISRRTVYRKAPPGTFATAEA